MLIYFENTGKVMKKVNNIAAGDIIFLFENESHSYSDYLWSESKNP